MPITLSAFKIIDKIIWQHFLSSTLIPIWINNHMSSKMGVNWEWISNFIPHFIMHIITYPCWDWSWPMLIKGAHGNFCVFIIWGQPLVCLYVHVLKRGGSLETAVTTRFRTSSKRPWIIFVHRALDYILDIDETSWNVETLRMVRISWYRTKVGQTGFTHWKKGGRLNINMSSYQYGDPHVKDKTVSRPSYI